MPAPTEIKRLYEVLAKGEMLELNFVPLPRRPPTPEHNPSPEMNDDEDAEKERERQERERKSVLPRLVALIGLLEINRFMLLGFFFVFIRPPTPTEFDFDEEQMQSTPKNAFLKRRRTPGEINKHFLQAETRTLSSFIFVKMTIFPSSLRVFRPLLRKARSSPGQGAVGHEAPPENRGAHFAHGAGPLQEREEAGGSAFPEQPEGAREGAGERQQPQHHLFPETEEVLMDSLMRTWTRGDGEFL